MKVDKLLKRFMKENNIFGNNESKEILTFLDDYEEAILPFNSFRWDTTGQGHDYWYDKTMKWVLHLYDNLEYIDEDDKKRFNITPNTIKDEMYELIKFYCLEGAKEEDLMKNDSYKALKEKYDELSAPKN